MVGAAEMVGVVGEETGRKGCSANCHCCFPRPTNPVLRCIQPHQTGFTWALGAHTEY
jgi:hypothetical protein